MRTVLLVLLAVAAPAFAAQTVWKWVDEQGVTHYSDRPVPGATKIEVNVGSRADSVSPGSTTPTTSEPEPQGPPYRDLEIWKPSQDETIVNTGGQVTVNVRVNPPLQSGHSLNLYLDGRLVEGFPPNATSFDLTEVPRGTHDVTVTVTDERGTRLQQSETVRFHVRQTSIAQPPVGPALRPPPKPPRTSGNKLPSRQPTYAELHGSPPKIDPRTNLPVKPPKPSKDKKPGG
ncbi:MAG TPA: DUF4124 domain-containing protein [Steroidobacteraceae bacterium]